MYENDNDEDNNNPSSSSRAGNQNQHKNEENGNDGEDYSSLPMEKNPSVRSGYTSIFWRTENDILFKGYIVQFSKDLAIENMYNTLLRNDRKKFDNKDKKQVIKSLNHRYDQIITRNNLDILGKSIGGTPTNTDKCEGILDKDIASKKEQISNYQLVLAKLEKQIGVSKDIVNQLDKKIQEKNSSLSSSSSSSSEMKIFFICTDIVSYAKGGPVSTCHTTRYKNNESFLDQSNLLLLDHYNAYEGLCALTFVSYI
ncbi:hypothetical protein DICPUDRAFT_146715 [Dictyostelium purpureum]|uniref:Uncharacterized protein n=1 Tax=Dictyostelium purpureum TaxID=5786 RepID=F0Z6U6_DICPU|nr:uncharacterized protein DICPUDRAFT_146715 [Dictyostelium purpureum]EGC40323.1 hypothetical protein DICPUDRAFT_146715 [Dictyostelium purpureum]|eukprot:XP_003283074.1 hypothetical protein DICPUDRAFT_146715 [Dictyostelium purpureum]